MDRGDGQGSGSRRRLRAARGTKVRILLVHEYYRQRGGEDSVFEAEARLLRSHRHEVVEYTEDNARIARSPLLAARVFWSRAAGDAVARTLTETRPVLAHFHNTFPLVSPSGYYACRRAGVPVVQTLHNYRLLCPAATLFRDGSTCDLCLNARVPWPGVLHSCYRRSVAQTAAVAGMLALHRALGTWRSKVDVFIAPSEFSRREFVEGGLPAEKILVKPHFVHPDPHERNGPGDYALFVGRLSEEKGVRLLLEAWQALPGAPLIVVGDGPLRQEVEHAGGVRAVGWLPADEVLQIMKGARFLVFPSLWPEPFGRVIIEAFACGLPVLASPLGAAGDLVRDEATGLHFLPGEPSDLAAKAAWIWAHPHEARAMGSRARREFEEKYAPEPNYRRLLEIYSIAMTGEAAGRIPGG